MNQLSRPSNAVLQCANKVAVKISGKRNGTADKYIERRCRKCWQCTTSCTNDMVGKLLAELTVCTRADLLTGTYSSETVEARMGAKTRLPRHVQLLVKSLRRRENRALRTYNRNEKKAALLEGREPKLVDVSKSYIQFYPVFEKGGNNGRGHWHVLIMYRSHFPVDLDGSTVINPVLFPETARRVWYPPDVKGAQTPGIPPDANNPDVIDWRCSDEGSQKHSLWPYGFVNFKCLSHDMQAVDNGGNPNPRRVPSEKVVGACHYLFKYLHKPEVNYRGEQMAPEKADQQEKRLTDARGGKSLYRTGSRGLGTDYASAFGAYHGKNGVPLQHVHFKMDGAKVPRSVASLAKYEGKLRKKGLDEIKVQQYLREAQQMVFQMQGGMLNAAADTFITIMKSKGISEKRYGDVGQIRLRQLAAKEANEWLRSPEGVFRRKVARRVAPLDVVWANAKLSKLPNSVAQMVSGVFFDKELPKCILPPEPFIGHAFGPEVSPAFSILAARGVERLTEYEKVTATHAAVSLVGDAYRRQGIDPVLYQTEKQNLSFRRNFVTPFVHQDEREARLNADEGTQALLERIVDEEWEAFFAGDNHSSDLLFALEMVKGSLAEPDKPWRVDETDGPADRIIKWLNFSDQYDWPKRREEYIKRFCAVRNINEDLRLLISPNGSVFMARRGLKDIQRQWVSSAGTGSRRSTIYKWGFRQIKDAQELSDAIGGKLSLRAFEKSCPIFSGVDPFKNNWAMCLNPLQKAVLALPAEVLDRPWPKTKSPYKVDPLLLEIPF